MDLADVFADGREWAVLEGHVLERLADLPEKCVQTVMTSPPYWGLRDYGTAVWEGGDPECDHLVPSGGSNASSTLVGTPARGRSDLTRPVCPRCGAERLEPTMWGGDPECTHVWNVETTSLSDQGPSEKSTLNGGGRHDPGTKYDREPTTSASTSTCVYCGAWRGQLGHESDPTAFVEHLCMVFDEVWRVLKDDGTVWLNLGDTYASSGGERVYGSSDDAVGRGPGAGRVDVATSGVKPKDLVGIPWRVAFALQARGWYLRSDIIWSKPNAMPESVTDRPTKAHEYVFLLTKNARYYYDADAVREPWVARANDISRATEGHTGYAGKHDAGYNGKVRGQPVGDPSLGRNLRTVWTVVTRPFAGAHFAVFPPKLVEPALKAGSRPDDIVLDPFNGSGTCGIVARRLGRRYIGIEVSPDFAAMARRRITEEGDGRVRLYADDGETVLAEQEVLW